MVDLPTENIAHGAQTVSFMLYFIGRIQVTHFPHFLWLQGTSNFKKDFFMLRSAYYVPINLLSLLQYFPYRD